MDQTPEINSTRIPGLEIAQDLEEANVADDIHRRAIIIDDHNDALMALADGKTSLLELVWVPEPSDWEPPPGLPRTPMDDMYRFSAHTSWFQAIGFYDVLRALTGGVTAQAFSIYLEDKDIDRALHRTMDMIAGLYAAADASLDPLGYNLAHLRVFRSVW